METLSYNIKANDLPANFSFIFSVKASFQEYGIYEIYKRLLEKSINTKIKDS